MKITKRCIPPKDRIWIGKCRSCNSEAEAIRHELKDIQHDQREGSYFCWMICPVCEIGPSGGMLFYERVSHSDNIGPR